MSTVFLKSDYMDPESVAAHGLVMPKTRRRTFIKEWRSFRRLTQEQLAEMANMSAGNLSLIERGLQSYTQETLELLAKALRCHPADLLTRDPADPDGIWAIWDDAKPAEKRQIVEHAKVIVRTASGDR